jgi:hypothetical protein
VGQSGNLTRATYTLYAGTTQTPVHLTGSQTLTINFYNGPGSTPLASYSLTSNSPANGYVFVNGPFGDYNANIKNILPITSGSNFRTTVTASAASTWSQTTNVSLQVQTSYLPLGN